MRIPRDTGAQLAAWPASAGSLSQGLGLSDSLAKPLIWIPTVCVTLLFGPAQALVLRWPVAPQGPAGAKRDVAVRRFMHDLERKIVPLNDSLGFASLVRERVRVPELKPGPPADLQAASQGVICRHAEKPCGTCAAEVRGSRATAMSAGRMTVDSQA